MVIFHSYVSLPEGTNPCLRYCIIKDSGTVPKPRCFGVIIPDHGSAIGFQHEFDHETWRFTGSLPNVS